MKKYKFIFLLVFLLITGCSSHNNVTHEVAFIDGEKVYQMIKNKDTYIIDVREDYEYKSGHLPNSYNIPLGHINSISLNNFSHTSTIIVYCRSGNRSNTAANLLIKLGYENVYDMGGITNWPYDLVIG
ncbi:rhodanese-like domain-containing protein [bacterium]|nr:rhodanese-like domain-containing protein [bacterium]